MAYGLGANVVSRFAAIAPQCGSFHRGFLDFPDNNAGGMPIMDVHGNADEIVPANLTRFNNEATDLRYPLSRDGWYYTQVDEILASWRVSNGCSGTTSHYTTPYDGVNGLFCVGERDTCAHGDVVRCSTSGKKQALDCCAKGIVFIC